MSTKAQKQSIALNKAQNNSAFELESLENQKPLFKLGYLKRVLDPIRDNPEELRTATITCEIREYT
jgi:hypothetical protein